MADKRKLKKKGQDVPVKPDLQPTKLEYAVASYMKKKVPTKRTKFLNHQVNYFYANKAIDSLLDSTWASGDDVIFTDRQSVVTFCDKLLRHKFFHRAKKIPITDKDLRPKDLKKKKEKEDKKKIVKKQPVEEKAKESDDSKKGGDDDDDDDEDKPAEKKKKKAKIKLDMHLEQEFIDGNDAYVWMYDPIPFWYYIIGALCLFGAVALCLFPLWPPSVRQGVYYLSIAAAGFLAVILGLAVLRFIIFITIWVLSMGRHHFWILPNLTEDVGFFESFWPLYHYKYKGKDFQKKSKKKKVGDEKTKDNGEEAIDSQAALDSDKDTEVNEDRGTKDSETDSNSNSQTFEVLTKEELSEATDE